MLDDSGRCRGMLGDSGPKGMPDKRCLDGLPPGGVVDDWVFEKMGGRWPIKPPLPFGSPSECMVGGGTNKIEGQNRELPDG